MSLVRDISMRRTLTHRGRDHVCIPTICLHQHVSVEHPQRLEWYRVILTLLGTSTLFQLRPQVLSVLQYYNISGDRFVLPLYALNIAAKLDHALAIQGRDRSLAFFGWDERYVFKPLAFLLPQSQYY